MCVTDYDCRQMYNSDVYLFNIFTPNIYNHHKIGFTVEISYDELNTSFDKFYGKIILSQTKEGISCKKEPIKDKEITSFAYTDNNGHVVIYDKNLVKNNTFIR